LARVVLNIYVIKLLRYLYTVESLHRADVIMTLSKMSFFIVSKVKKADSVSVNNFNKIKNMFIIFCTQH